MLGEEYSYKKQELTFHVQELTVVLRHQVASPYRRAFLPHIEKLLYERVLVGAIVGIQETTR